MTDLKKEIEDLKAQLQQYKSLVKKVDADNLPNGEVLTMDGGKLYLGQLVILNLERLRDLLNGFFFGDRM